MAVTKASQIAGSANDYLGEPTLAAILGPVRFSNNP